MKNWKFWAYVILCGMCGGLFASGVGALKIEVWVLSAVAFFSLVIAFCAVTDAKKEKQKRWNETSLLLSTEKELEAEKEMSRHSAEAVLWYANELVQSMGEAKQLQDRLSSILCPHNDHIWIGGKCMRCGRTKDGR